ncbi:MAG: hypothetical protein ABR514_11430 [Chthoniobacterales bacterium]
MSPTKSMIILAMLVIALGIAWLLNTLGVIPGVDWLWTGGLGVAGILVLAASGVNKFSFVIGAFLMVSSIFSVLRQTGRLREDIEIPVLFIIFGVLLLLSLLLPLPTPPFLREDQRDEKN